MKAIILAIASAAAGALVVVACSDDSPGDADAAVCDCPAAEPPITAARIHRVDGTVVAAVNTISSPGAECPAGEILLSGSCYIDDDQTGRELSLLASGAVPEEAAQAAAAWHCHFLNRSLTITATVRAQAFCLKPAP